MPTKRPQYLPGHYYHFLNRGAHRLPIFREPRNYEFVLRSLKLYCSRFRVPPIAYCLMPNHYHLLLRQDGDFPARLVPHRVFNSYSKAFNRRYGHSGTLFQGNYRVVHVQRDEHLLHLWRYIHANPVKDGLIADVALWPHSNYLEWVGERPGALVDRAFVAEWFPAPEDYRAFLADYLVSKAHPDDLSYLESW